MVGFLRQDDSDRQDMGEVIGKGLTEARCVVVAWPENSIMSSWVQEEADEGRERGILIPLLIDPVKPPMGFRSVQAANLVNWNGEIQSPAKSVFRLDEYLAL